MLYLKHFSIDIRNSLTSAVSNLLRIIHIFFFGRMLFRVMPQICSNIENRMKEADQEGHGQKMG